MGRGVTVTVERLTIPVHRIVYSEEATPTSTGTFMRNLGDLS